tara:strand:+ start:902 stop:1066 length:165 start_codon:yes stop_codon:yes gene_type:complete
MNYDNDNKAFENINATFDRVENLIEDTRVAYIRGTILLGVWIVVAPILAATYLG